MSRIFVLQKRTHTAHSALCHCLHQGPWVPCSHPLLPKARLHHHPKEIREPHGGGRGAYDIKMC